MEEFDCSNDNIKKSIETNYFLRNKYLIRLINIIGSTNTCSAFAIDGKWGSGKTVFMHQLKYLITEENTYNEMITKDNKTKQAIEKIECFYFNAWENDLINNPAMNMLHSLINQYSIFNVEDKQKYCKLLDILVNIGLKISTGGILEISDFKNDNTNENNSLMEKIKKVFNETVDTIKSVKKIEKIVIIIDELDRCRPPYAVELLETLKHFYKSDGLIFLISTDITQLSHSVRNLYGNNFDAELYLQRFFDAVFTLNAPKYERYINYGLEYDIQKTYLINEISKLTIDYYDLSIREVNKLIKQLKIILPELIFSQSLPLQTLSEFLFVPWGLALKYKNNTTFEKFKNGRFDKKEFSDFLDFKNDILDLITNNYFQSEQNSNNFNIIEELYDMYLFLFREDKIRYYKIDYTKSEKYHSIDKEYIQSLIEF